jgi:hypothetical protein
MVAEVSGGETVLTGWLADQAAVFGALAQIEALGLELLELRQVRPTGEDNTRRGVSPTFGEDSSPGSP